MAAPVLDEARWLHSQGIVPLPLQYRGKQPLSSDWPHYDAQPEDFREQVNIGVLLGSRSGHLADVDFDWQEAAELGQRLLPQSWSYGRRGRDKQTRLRHMLYRCEGAETLKLQAPPGTGDGKRCIIEIRADGLQSVVPPSVLDDDAIIWINDPRLTDLHQQSPDDLREAVQVIAGAALLARIWPTLAGSRHDLMLCLAGACFHAGWPVGKAERVLQALLDIVPDEERHDRTKALRDTLARAAAGEPVTGLPTLLEQLPADVIGCLQKWWGLGGSAYAGLTINGQPADSVTADPGPQSFPEPLPVALRPVPSFPLDGLPDSFRAYVVDIAERMQCPPDFPAVGLMIVTAAVVGGQLAVRPKQRDDWEEIPNLWGAVIGRPGLLKTPALAEPMGLLRELEAEARAVYDKQAAEYQLARFVYEESLKAAREKAREELRKGAIRPADVARLMPEVPVEPVRKRYIINDSTVEKVADLLAKNPNGLLLFRDEVTGFIATLEHEKHAGERKFYLECHSGRLASTVDRIGRGTIDIPRLCLSLLGGIQPGPLSLYQRQALSGGSRDDGLFQRFQLLVWPDAGTPSQLVDRLPDDEARQKVRAVLWQLADINVQALGAVPPAKVGQGGQVAAQPFLRFVPDAQPLFNEWWAELHREIERSESEALSSHLSKYRGLIPSLALLIHLADGGGSKIPRRALEKALAWYPYLLGHAQRIYSFAPQEAMTAAALLLKRLYLLPDPFTARDVYRRTWAGLQTTEKTEAALAVLADYGHVLPKLRRSTAQGGRGTVDYFKSTAEQAH